MKELLRIIVMHRHVDYIFLLRKKGSVKSSVKKGSCEKSVDR